MVRARADAVVIGAGIAGTATAYYLACLGMQVALVDRAGVCSGTSGSGEGNLLVSDKDSGPELDLAIAGLALWKTLCGELESFEYEEKGGVVVARDDAELQALTERAGMLRAHGVDAAIADRAELRVLEPQLTHDVEGALFVRDDAQVQPMLACMAFAAAARARGAAIYLGDAVQSIELDARRRVRAVRTACAVIGTSRVVIAAGPWTPPLCLPLGVALPVFPRKGHIVVTEPLPEIVRHKVYEANYAAAVQSDERDTAVSAVVESTHSGNILIGSSREFAGFDARINAEVLAAMTKRAVALFPALASVHAIRAYAGFRPFVSDHLPIIGALADVEGVWVNTGHEGAGIGLGPISARALAETICERPSAFDLTPFSPTRFAGGSHELAV